MGRTFPNEIQRILFKPGGDVGRACRRITMEIAAEAKRIAENRLGRNPLDAPRTGNLSRAYQVKVVEGTNEFYVQNRKKYAAAIEWGARPHEIRARRVTYLQFRDRQGRLRRVKMVRHPGNAAYKVLTDAMTRVMVRNFGSVQRRS